jgi:hypothetical protein
MASGITSLLETYETRELQLEAARVVASHPATNKWIRNFKANHDSTDFYRKVVEWYINEYGGMPSETGPGKNVKLLWI